MECLGCKKPEAQSNAPIIPPWPASKRTGEAQYPTFCVNLQNGEYPPPPRILCKGDYYAKGGGTQDNGFWTTQDNGFWTTQCCTPVVCCECMLSVVSLNQACIECVVCCGVRATRGGAHGSIPHGGSVSAQGPRRATFWAISDPYPWGGIPNKAPVMRGDVASLPNCGPSSFLCY